MILLKRLGYKLGGMKRRTTFANTHTHTHTLSLSLSSFQLHKKTLPSPLLQPAKANTSSSHIFSLLYLLLLITLSLSLPHKTSLTSLYKKKTSFTCFISSKDQIEQAKVVI